MVKATGETVTSDFRRQAASAVIHPVTLGALAVLLANDLLFKALWPGAWMPGKLSDLAWMVFAPPVLAYVLSFATVGHIRAQRAAFAAAYAALPLLYAAFNTFQPVHDVVLRVLGLIGGDGPRSPFDPTDSLVIPLAMAAALWVWAGHPWTRRAYALASRFWRRPPPRWQAWLPVTRPTGALQTWAGLTLGQ